MASNDPEVLRRTAVMEFFGEEAFAGVATPKRNMLSESDGALPNEAAGGSEARDHLPAYPARGPEPTFATAGGSLGTRRLDVEVLSTSSASLFEIGTK